MNDDQDRRECELHAEKVALIHANNLLQMEINKNNTRITAIRIELVTLAMAENRPLATDNPASER